ncbi:MAG: P-loop NTPase fold protein [Sphingomonas sp.]
MARATPFKSPDNGDRVGTIAKDLCLRQKSSNVAIVWGLAAFETGRASTITLSHGKLDRGAFKGVADFGRSAMTAVVVNLRGDQYETITTLLRDGFESYDQLAEFTETRVGLRLNNVTSESAGLEVAAFKIVQYAESQRYLALLLAMLAKQFQSKPLNDLIEEYQINVDDFKPLRVQQGPAKRTRRSRHIARFGDVSILEIQRGVLTGLGRFDAIVVPVDGRGAGGQFLEGLSEVDPVLGKSVERALAIRRNSKDVFRKAEALDFKGPPLMIAAIGSVGGSSVTAATAHLRSATKDAIEIARTRDVERLLFPLLSVGSGGGEADAGAAAFFEALLIVLGETPKSSKPLEIHICTRDREAMGSLRAMLRKEEEDRQSNEKSDETSSNSEEKNSRIVDAGPNPDPGIIARPSLRLAGPGYRTDSLTEKPRDFVGVGAEVLAFARLAASREIEPPLAVGVFGDWGSGKSFFMNGVRRKIEELGAAEDLRIAKAQRDGADLASGIHTNVVQIEFNA